MCWTCAQFITHWNHVLSVSWLLLTPHAQSAEEFTDTRAATVQLKGSLFDTRQCILRYIKMNSCDDSCTFSIWHLSSVKTNFYCVPAIWFPSFLMGFWPASAIHSLSRCLDTYIKPFDNSTTTFAHSVWPALNGRVCKPSVHTHTHTTQTRSVHCTPCEVRSELF